MTTTTFTSGTVIASAWLNDVNRKTYTENVSVTDFATLALAAASGAAGLVVPAGTYTLTANLTFNMPVHMMPGAVITVPTGMTLTFNKAFTAGLYQVFDCEGTGAVEFDSGYTSVGYPEWWGAVGMGGAGSTATNVAAINACLVACRVTQLQATTYWVDAKIHMALPNRALKGYGQHYTDDTNPVTRLYTESATITILQVGPDAYPGSVNALYQGNLVEDITVVRGTGPDIPTTAKGVAIQYVLYAQIRNVRSHDSIYGFQLYGTVNCTLERCYAFRSTVGTGSGTDLFYGFYVNGTAVLAGLNSANASLFLIRCNATQSSGTVTASSGFYLDSINGFTDVFMDFPETTFTSIGINIQGNTSNTTLNYTNANLKIRGPILDGFTQYGIFMTNLNKFGGITITDPYGGAGAAGATGIAVTSSTGTSVSIIGGQLLMSTATTGFGMLFTDTDGIVVKGTQILEAVASPVEISNLRFSYIAPVIKNQSSTVTNAGIRMFSTCTRNTFAPIMYGKSAAFPLGMQLVGASHGYNEFNCTGIDPTSLSGGLSSGKLNNNGTAITATGLFGTNLASGVMS